MDLLSDRAGATGETVGVDNEARMIAMARDVAAELNLTNLTLVEAEATGTGLERAAFDLAHARLLLVNVPDPEQVVAELASLVRPGVLSRFKSSTGCPWVCQPPHPAWDGLRDALRDFRARRGLDVCMGRRLPGLLRGAGLGEVGFRAVCPAYIDGAGDNHTLLVTFAKLHGAALAADGLVAADELASLVAELEAHLADPATITIYCLSASVLTNAAGHAPCFVRHPGGAGVSRGDGGDVPGPPAGRARDSWPVGRIVVPRC